MTTRSFVIVGAGLAGASAAAALRKRGSDGRIVVIGAESHLPYERPSLSKDYLRGGSDRSALLARSDSFYRDNAIDVRTSVAATDIVPRERVVVLTDGSRVPYDRLLLSTGAAPRRLAVPGGDLPGIHHLRTIEDADSIRAAAATAGYAVVVGGGWIGAEVAASLRQLGHRVTLVAPTSVPLERVLGPEVGAVYRDLHVRHGVELAMGRRIRAVGGRRRVEAVELDDGSRLEADLVVVGIGAVPRMQIAARAGLAVGDGIEVDETLETSVPGIFAAGDAASAWHPAFGRRIRVEHWDNAKRQGAAAAAGMLGEREPYARVPYFFSDQFDLSMEYAGHAPAWNRVVFRGHPASGIFVAFWLNRGRLLAGMNANVEGASKAISALVASRRPVAVDRLVDQCVPLDDIDALTVQSAVARRRWWKDDSKSRIVRDRTAWE
ncbi:MAG TPA: FAD-dependent oxidoreductase [Candidatus Saccharimonadales bacterium]|nr:FAD-dependent oxidoreductase [Candidatus Saccharimonadales bacterium]